MGRSVSPQADSPGGYKIEMKTLYSCVNGWYIGISKLGFCRIQGKIHILTPNLPFETTGIEIQNHFCWRQEETSVKRKHHQASSHT